MAADFDFVHKDMVVSKLWQSVAIKFLSEASSLIQILPFWKMPNYPIKKQWPFHLKIFGTRIWQILAKNPIGKPDTWFCNRAVCTFIEYFVGQVVVFIHYMVKECFKLGVFNFSQMLLWRCYRPVIVSNTSFSPSVNGFIAFFFARFNQGLRQTYRTYL